jgi:hypothetical protein
MTGVSVLIAIPTHRDFPPHTVFSLLDSCRAAFQHNVPVRVLIEPGISVVEVARSICVHRFLQGNATKLFFIDSDMQWDEGSFLRLLALSTKADVVCASYPAKEEPLTFHLSTPGRVTTNEYGCIPCRGSGLGFVVIDRKVLEAFVADAPTIRYPRGDSPEDRLISFKHPFRSGLRNGEFFTEDIMFYRDVEALGFTIWCDPTVWLGHIGVKSYEGSLIDHMREKQGVAA